MSVMAEAMIVHFFCVFNKNVVIYSFRVLQMKILGIYCLSLPPEHTPDASVMIERSPPMNFKMSTLVTKPDFTGELTASILAAAASPDIISFAGGLPNPVSFPIPEM